LTGKDENGVFKTAQKAAYPPLMCEAIAEMCFGLRGRDPFGTGRVVAAPVGPEAHGTKPEDSATDISSSEEAYTHRVKHKRGQGLWGRAPPLTTKVAGKVREFADGCGLCSPGRWAPKHRIRHPSGLPEAVRNICMQNME
jgi:hypothetical protein